MLGQCFDEMCWASVLTECVGCWQEGEEAREAWEREEACWREKCDNYRERAAELQDTVTKLTVSVTSLSHVGSVPQQCPQNLRDVTSL